MAQPRVPAGERETLSPAELEALGLKPGDRAHLEVEIYDHPAPDLTNIRVVMRGLMQRWWVPTKLLRRIPPS